MKEIERKWVLECVNGVYLPFEFSFIEQGYLFYSDNDESRIRTIDGKHFFTVKGGTGLSREEVELEVQIPMAKFLWQHIIGSKIKKRRYNVLVGEYKIEVDFYLGHLAGLVTAECEFENEIDAADFEFPKKLARGFTEVTYDEKYKNKNLALYGLPEGALDICK